MMEKITMWLFIVFTIVFAGFMLYDTQDEPVITDALMMEKTKT